MNLELREQPLSRFLDGSYRLEDVDYIFLQTWFNTELPIVSLVNRIRTELPHAKIIYLDWFAPTDLRFANDLCGRVDAYVKKQILREFSHYGQPTVGETNLTDYYAKRFDIDLPKVTFAVPAGFRDTVMLGHGFERAPSIIKHSRLEPNFSKRSIDVHARIGARGTPWYAAMRNEARRAVSGLPLNLNVAHQGKVVLKEFFRELRDSKLCFSPFGYGEICWRDFEAMASGAMLLKPDVSHLHLVDNYFEPFETYVPVSWDLSDFAEKVRYYVSHDLERTRIARNAYMRLKNKRSFLSESMPLWKRLGLAS